MSRSKRARRRHRGRLKAPAEPRVSPARLPTPSGPSPREDDVSQAPEEASMAPGGRPRRWRRVVLLGGAVAAALVLVLGMWAGTLASERPAWFDATDPALSLDDPRRVAVSAENALTTAFTATRDAEDRWTVTISERVANAWLDERLPLWLEREAPGIAAMPLGRVAVDFRPGQLALAAEFHGERADEGGSGGADDAGSGGADEEHGSIRSIEFAPAIDAMGHLLLRPQRVLLNRLAVPSSVAAALLPESIEPEVRRTVARVIRGEPLGEPPMVRVDNGRVVRIHAVVISDDGIQLICTTEPSRSDDAAGAD